MGFFADDSFGYGGRMSRETTPQPPPCPDYVVFDESHVWEDSGAFPSLDRMGHWYDVSDHLAGSNEEPYYMMPYPTGLYHAYQQPGEVAEVLA